MELPGIFVLLVASLVAWWVAGGLVPVWGNNGGTALVVFSTWAVVAGAVAGALGAV